MSKKPPLSAPAPQEEELVVTVVRFKGSGETARKGIDALQAALANAFGPAQVATRQLNGRKAAALPPPDTIDGETVDDTDAGETVEQDDVQAAAPAAPKATGKPKSKLPKFDDKLAVTPFKTFAAERNPQTVDEKYLVACLWLQEESGAATYGASQVFTCFRAMKDWPTYDDFTQPMRVMKAKKSYFADTDKRGEWKLTDHGLDEARKIKHPATA